MIGYVVVIVLAVLILIGLINKKKMSAKQQKVAEEKKAAEQKAAEGKKATEQKAVEEKKATGKADIAPFTSKEAKQYYEMAYGLLSSCKERSLDDIRRFVGFHTSRETDYSVSSSARKFLNEGSRNGMSLFKSNDELTQALTAKGISDDAIEKIIELNKKLDETLAYRYSAQDADTICNSDNYDYNTYNKTLVFNKPKDSIVLLSQLICDETIKQYTEILSGLSESIQSTDIDLDEARKYIEYYTKQSCDQQKLQQSLKLIGDKGAQEKFGITDEDINKYKCSKSEAYSVCNPEKVALEQAAVEEFDSIFAILEKSGATLSNFEKGIEHFLAKKETSFTKEKIFPAIKKALFARAFGGDNSTVAKTVVVDYFIQEVVKGPLLEMYMRFAIAKEKGDFSGWMASYVQVLYGIAGHVFTYQCNRANPEKYQAITPDEFKIIIEHSDVLKSYTDSDPFTVDTVRENWAKDMCESPLKMVRSSKLGDLLDNEKYLDEICYLTYIVLRKDQDNSGEDASVSEIAVIYTDFLKEIYDRINR